MANGSVVIVGGTQGIGRELAQSYADEGRDVIVTGRDQSRAEAAAKEIGGSTRGIGFDLAEPHTIAGRLEDVGDVEHLVLVAIERDVNKVKEYDIDGRAAARHAEARRLHRGDPRARAAASRWRQHPHVRRPRARPSVPRLDHGDDRQRRRHGPRADARDRARADESERRSIRPSSATARSGSTCRRSVSRRSWIGRRSGVS